MSSQKEPNRVFFLRKNTKFVATRCQILRLKCTKFNFGWGSASDPAGELTVLPSPLAGFKGPISKGMEGKGCRMGEEESKGKGEGRRGGKGKGGKEKGSGAYRDEDP